MSGSTPTPRAQDRADDHRPSVFDKLRRFFSLDSGESESVRDVIEELIEERFEENPDKDATIDPNERLLLSNVLKLRDVAAADIMVPRADIVAVEAKTSLAAVLALLAKEGHSRFPVYRETLDDVAGFVHIKDLAILAANNLPASANGKAEDVPQEEASARLIDMVRPALFVSPSVRVMDLLLEMRLKRTHMAMVVDEYGGIDGLLTIEDVVEQIVGEIEDEHDDDDAPKMVQRNDGTVLANARVMLEGFESQHGVTFTEEEREEADTLGGLVARLAGRVPGRGELVKHPSGLEFEVLDGDPRHVRRLRIRGLPSRQHPTKPSS
jgi:magnesium and cobalt transporter